MYLGKKSRPAPQDILRGEWISHQMSGDQVRIFRKQRVKKAKKKEIRYHRNEGTAGIRL